VVGLGRLIPWAVIAFGLTIVAFALSRHAELSILLLVCTGAAMMLQMASSNTILQTIVDDDKRGRVMSFYSMAFMGAAPFGSLLAGVLADSIGAPLTLAIGGSFCVVGALYFMHKLPRLRKEVHPIYERLGILPEVAKGLQTATDLANASNRR
jgi:MFS family permease